MSRRSTAYRGRLTERIVGIASGLSAASVLAFLFGILAVLIAFAWPSILFNGLHFFTRLDWNLGNLYGGVQTGPHGVKAPLGASYGLLVFLVGTLTSSVVALVLAIPVAIGVAIFLTEYAPRRLARALSTLVELLSGVPSVIFGLWGLAVVVPLIQGSLGPWLSRIFGFLPFMAGPVGTGEGLLASGVVLGIMVVPIIAAISRDVLWEVPHDLKDQGRALGITEGELIRHVVLPHARNGIVGAIILGLGRALGETMAVLMISGNATNFLPHNIYSPISTMAATIVALLDSAMTDSTGMAVHALAEIALVLFVITLAVNLLVPVILRGAQRTGSQFRTERVL